MTIDSGNEMALAMNHVRDVLNLEHDANISSDLHLRCAFCTVHTAVKDSLETPSVYFNPKKMLAMNMDPKLINLTRSFLSSVWPTNRAEIK